MRNFLSNEELGITPEEIPAPPRIDMPTTGSRGLVTQADFPRVSPEEQIERDKTALRIKYAELQDSPNDPMLRQDVGVTQVRVEQGKPFGRVKASTVITEPTVVDQNDAYYAKKLSERKFLSNEELGITTPEPRFTDKAVDYTKTSAKNAVGSTMVLLDMMAGLPGMAMNVGAYTAARAKLALMGEDSKIGAKAAQEIAADLVPEAISAPFHKIMKSLGYEDVYNDSTVGQAMNFITGKIEQGSDWYSEQTNGVLQPADVQALVNAGMAWMGAKGGDVAIKRGLIAKETLKRGEQIKEARKTYADESTADAGGPAAAPDGQPLSPADLAKQHVEARYADPNLQGPAAAQFWKERGQEMRNTFDDPVARRQYEQTKRALVKERKNAVKSPAVVVEEKLAANSPREGTPQEVIQQYKEEVLGMPKESPRISEGDATRLYAIPAFQRTAAQRIQLKQYENSLRTEGMFGPGSVADQVKSYAAKNPGVTGAALGAVAGGIAYLNSDEGDSVLPAVMASFIPVVATHPRAKLAQQLEKAGASPDHVWKATQLFKNENGQWVKEISNRDASLNPNLPRVWNEPNKVVPAYLEAGVPLGGILQDRRLYMNMPELADIPVLGPLSDRVRGSFDTKVGTMRLRPGEPEQVKSTALHETQHAIQTERGMPAGGSPEQFLSPIDSAFIREAEMRSGVLEMAIRKDTGAFDSGLVQQAVEQVQKGQRMSAAVAREFNKIQNHPLLPDYLRVLEDRIKADDLYMEARDKYLRLPGEIEARAVQARMNMLPEELRITPPWRTYGLSSAEGWPTKLAVGAAAVAAGGWLFFDEAAAEKVGVGGLVLAGAIKGKGGMWHPEAVTRLAAPLRMAMDRNLGMEVPTARTNQIVSWSDNAVKNYLNKHAGTATDPLKDVRIPMLGDDVRWEDVWDRVIGGKEVHGPKGPETEWDISGTTGYAGGRLPEGYREALEQGTDLRRDRIQKLGALTSYLSHVGDYLREFVPADKLQQYDLVRAVKETAKQDEIQAAKMAKARVNQAGTVDYKVYPDGMKWVEVGKTDNVKLPDGWGVKSAGDMRGFDAYSPRGPFMRGGTREQALKAALDTYNKEISDAALKNEGDVMGHCVGGYCEMVHSGESKIYSLRDEKGMSHVTVEVAPPKAPTYHRNNPNLKMGLGHEESNILQIKGKQNRAPVDKYLPYVQDFVKSGKWGDVGDLQNTGLADITTRLPKQSAYNSDWLTFAKDRLGEGRYFSRQDVDTTWQEFLGPRTNKNTQRGSIDPELAKKLGAVAGGAALGAYLDKDERLGGAVAGGTLGLLGAAALARSKGRNVPVNRGVDYALGEVSTRIGNMGEMGHALKLQLRKFEGKVLSETKAVTDKVGPFLRDMKGLPDVIKQQVSLALLQQDMPKVRQLLAGSSDMLKNFAAVQQVLADFERVHKQMGRFKQGITDYFPRIIADYEGLQKHLGVQAAAGLDEWLNKAEKHMLRTENRLLTDVEQSILINRYLLADAPLSSLPPHLRKRTVREVTQQLQPFYEAPERSLSRYVHAAVQDIEMAKLFGKNLKLSKASHGTRAINIDESIGAYVRDARQAGHLTGSQEAQLKDILKSRFGPGEQGARPTIQHIRNVANMGLLGNFVSAATQFSDLAMAVYSQGLFPTMQAVGKSLTGKSINPKDFGLANHISEEFTGTVGSARALQKVFKYSGFSAVDMLGKRLILTSALDKYQRLATTSKGQAIIAEKYQKAFGNDFADLLRDLRNKTKSENVDTLLFSELSDLQPISKMEMPQAYLDMPNGRVIYMLKSFMLKQMDIVRRDMFQEFLKPGLEHKQKALANLTRYAITVGVAGATVDMVKDFIMGKPFDAKWEDVPLNLLKTFGWSKYTLDKAKGGHPVEAVAGMMAPPYAMMDDIIRRDPKAWNYVPLMGKIYYERNKDTWKEQRAWDRKHDPALRMERRMKRLEENAQ